MEKAAAIKTSRQPYQNLVCNPNISQISSEYADRHFTAPAIAQELAADINKLDRLCAYIIVEMATDPKFQPNEPHYQPHIHKFLSRIRRSVFDEDHSLREAASVSSSDRLATISAITAQMKEKVEVELIDRIFQNLETIVNGGTSGLEVALKDGLLSQLYASSIGIVGAYLQLSRLVDLCAFRNPHMNILEIGAGTGGATDVVLKQVGLSGMDLQLKDCPSPFNFASAFFSTCRSESVPATIKYSDPKYFVNGDDGIRLCDLLASRYDQINYL